MVKEFNIFINEKSSETYKEGDYIINIEHPEFGVGKIISISDGKTIIEFENETGRSRGLAKPKHGWIGILDFSNYELTDKRPKRRIRWYDHGKLLLERIQEHEWKQGDLLKYHQHPEFGIGKIMLMDETDIIIEFENPTGVNLPRHPAKFGYGWSAGYPSMKNYNYFEYVPSQDLNKKNRIRWYNHGKLVEEQFSFEKIESEEITINLDDYIEEYDNIFKDRYRCIKAVGPVHQSGDVFKIDVLFKRFKQFGIHTNRKERYERDTTERFEILHGSNCDVEQIHRKNGDFIVIWPGKGDRDYRLKKLSDNNFGNGKDKFLDKIVNMIKIKRYLFHLVKL